MPRFIAIPVKGPPGRIPMRARWWWAAAVGEHKRRTIAGAITHAVAVSPCAAGICAYTLGTTALVRWRGPAYPPLSHAAIRNGH